MKIPVIVALCWAGGLLASGQELAFQTNFSGYAEGALPPAWEIVSGTGRWRIENKQLVVTATNGLCQTRAVPELEALDFSARLKISARSSPTDWATAGIAIVLDGQNHWRLNLAEGPDQKRYMEFGETFAGKWQAQNEGVTRLQKGKGVFGTWSYGTEYVLRIVLSAREISGEVAEAESGRIIASHRYLWDGAEGVKYGRPGFSVHGFNMAVSSVSVTVPRASTPGGAPAVEAGPAGRVALVKDLPGFEPVRVNAIAAAFRRFGWGVTLLGATDLAAPAVFSSRNFDAVVLPGSRFFPTVARDNFLRFLRNGGHCVVLGGNVFEEPVAWHDGRWFSRADVARELATARLETMLIEPGKTDARSWRHGTDALQSSSAVAVQEKSFRFDIKGLKGWDTFSAKIPAPPAGQSLLCFRAKGDAATPEMTVEVDEQDGSRWIAVVDLAPEWKSYALAPDRFLQWEARALKKESFTPTNAARLSLGLAANFNPRAGKGDHTFWVEAVGMASNLLAHIDLSRKVDLNIFYDYEPYHLTNVVAFGTAAGNKLTPSVPPVSGPLGGMAAVGFAFPNESKFIPLLSALDEHGRDGGWAAGMLVNYGGTYRGSTWIFCGITNQSFYTAPAVLDTITAALKAARGDLASAALAENARAKQAVIKLTTPAPKGFIHLSPDGKHLVLPDNRRFFMSGCNYVGPFDRCGGRLWRDDYFDAAILEEDFRKAQQAGLNSMRYWVSGIDRDIKNGDLRKVDAIRECAWKYGVYLLLDLPGTSYASVEEMTASHRAIAGAFKDEPMIIGYDLRNEPYLGTVAGIRYPAESKPAILTTDFVARHGDLVSAKLVRDTVEQRPEWLHLPRAVRGSEAENATAAILLWSQYARQHHIESATVKGLTNRLPTDERYNDVVAAADQSFGLWARLQIEAIRAVDTNHLITIGYDTAFTGLPSNRQLDFVSQHVYARPHSLADVMENLTTLDRLATVWPDKPITFGEFGYSTGVPMAGGYLDRYTASVGEMMHYLYAFTKNYDGVKKWMLNDWPFKIMQHYGDWNKGDVTRTYEERFGLYYYDGTATGRPKPIAHALRFFGEHIAGRAPSGSLEVLPAPLSIGAGYVYKNQQALFIGNTSYTTDQLAFTAARPANVMLRWADDGLRIMASADTHVQIKPTAFGRYGKEVTGRHGALRVEGDTLVVDLLEGETILIK